MVGYLKEQRQLLLLFESFFIAVTFSIMTTHASRNTTTGTTYEKEFAALLEQYTNIVFDSQVIVGQKRNGGEHVVDLLINGEVKYNKGFKRPISLHRGGVLVSLKYQNVGGTAEEKIPFEFMKLHHTCIDFGYESAILVLAGPDKAWKWKKYYLSEQFRNDMKQIYPTVCIISHEQFAEEFLRV
jgi:hypothetical protein